MARLGKRQLEKMQSLGTSYRQIAPDKMILRLIELGYAESPNEDGSFASLTSNGLRRFAEAMDEGRVSIKKSSK
jgi:hypothetical protein